jgi:hypothetical protein
MSRIGKLYRYYLEKIWQKNWLRIVFFTILIGVIWWFIIPWLGRGIVMKAFNSNATEYQKDMVDENKLSSVAKLGFGSWDFDKERKETRELLENETKVNQFLETLKKAKAIKNAWDEIRFKLDIKSLDSANFRGISFPFTADNAFFFSQTNSYNSIKEGSFWKLLNDISWWNLSSFIILYWFIFVVFDKLFFSQKKEGEEAIVLTMTPRVKRSDLLWSKLFSFLTFYSVINIFLFLIPFSVYYWWLASSPSLLWFSLLSLWTIIFGPLLFFSLIFAPYLFFGSLNEGMRWLFSTLLISFPMIWSGVKILSSANWIKTAENTFFHPVWFIIISLVCGIFFFTLYYFNYQKEDLS